MDQKIKQKWVKALRGGRYKQTDSMLKSHEGYCCLGVLCEVVGAKWRHADGDLCAFLGDEKITISDDQLLADRFRRRIGLRSQSQKKLTELNDGRPDKDQPPRDFKKIADYIEKHY